MKFEILIHFLRNNIIYLVETFTAISINMEGKMAGISVLIGTGKVKLIAT